MRVDTTSQGTEVRNWETAYITHLFVSHKNCPTCKAKVDNDWGKVLTFSFNRKEWERRRRNRYYNRKFGSVTYPEPSTCSS